MAGDLPVFTSILHQLAALEAAFEQRTLEVNG
jgi:hypothetical protein